LTFELALFPDVGGAERGCKIRRPDPDLLRFLNAYIGYSYRRESAGLTTATASPKQEMKIARNMK